MNTIVTILHFKYRGQNRLTLVRLLCEYNTSWGLAKAKEALDRMVGPTALDRMVRGEPIIIDIERNKIEQFAAKLDELNLEFTIE